MNNNLKMVAQLMRGRDPKEVVLQQVKNNNITDPNITALIKYAESGDEKQLINLATQLFQARGLDLNSEFNSFLSLMK